jgi:hypothetical protein
MKKPSKFPPGPPKVPFLGGTPFIMQRGSLFHGLRKLVSEYGPLSGFYFGNTPVVVVADYQILKGKLATSVYYLTILLFGSNWIF